MLTRLTGLGTARLVRPGPVVAPAPPPAAPAPDLAAAASPAISPAVPTAASPADAVRAVLQELADVGADAEGEPRRVVPALAPHALGDQLTVLARDVLALAAPGAPLDPVTDRGTAVLDAVAERLAALRRALP